MKVCFRLCIGNTGTNFMEQNPAGECDSRVGIQISILHKNWRYVTGLTKDRRWTVTSQMNAVYIHRMLMSAVPITLLWFWDHYAVAKRRVPYILWRGFSYQKNWYVVHIAVKILNSQYKTRFGFHTAQPYLYFFNFAFELCLHCFLCKICCITFVNINLVARIFYMFLGLVTCNQLYFDPII